MTINTLYDQDFRSWIQENINALQKSEFNTIDIPNIIKELEGMSKSIEKELRYKLKVLMHHILLYKYQRKYLQIGWVGKLTELRQDIEDILDENPSLKKEVRSFCERKYNDAVVLAAFETRKPKEEFPKSLELSEYEILEKEYKLYER